MTDQEKIKRTLKVLMDLPSPFGITINELSTRHDITERTVYRYIRTLRETGFVIENNNGYFKIDKDQQTSKDISELLHFSREESYVLQKAIHNLDENNVIKQNLVQKLYSLYNSRNIANSIIQKNVGENVRLLCDAIDNKSRVVLKNYQSANGSTISDRKVEPCAFTTNYISLWGYDLEKNDNRLFKTARIGKVESSYEAWKYEHKHLQQELDVFRMAGKEQTHIILDMSMRAANLMTEEYPLSEKYLTSIPHNRFRFQGIIHSYHGAGRFILGLMDEIEVIEPEDFKKYLNKKIEKKRF
ncbi:MAG: WYL domain-containing protein [Bacteroidales bacterium]|nr:WYL domain-containing protein [Bacteroidales bacterium]